MAYPTLAVEIDFNNGPLTALASRTWTDVTSYVVRNARVNYGRRTEVESSAPGGGSLVLNNKDRRFDPNHDTGPYYGKLLPRRAIRIRATVANPTGAFNETANGLPISMVGSPTLNSSGLTLNGTTQYAETPDNSELDISTQSVALVAEITPTSWAPAAEQVVVGKWSIATGGRSYALSITTSGGNGILRFRYSTDGNASTQRDSTAHGITGRSWVAVYFNRETGDTSFYRSTDGIRWTLISTSAGAGSPITLFQNSAVLSIGRFGGTGSNYFSGTIHQVKVYQDTLTGQSRKLLDACFCQRTYNVAYGFIEAWPQEYQGAWYSEVPVTWVDGFGLFSQFPLTETATQDYIRRGLIYSPAVWYRFGDTSDVLRDSSGYGRDGQYRFYNPTLGAEFSNNFVSDSSGESLLFESRGASWNVATNNNRASGQYAFARPGWMPSTNAWTISMWIRCAPVTATARRFYCQSEGANGIILEVAGTTGRVTAQVTTSSGTVTLTYTSARVDDSRPHNIVLSRNSTTLYLSVDGSYTTAAIANQEPGVGWATISWFNSSRDTVEAIDEFMGWDLNLPFEQFSYLYEAGSSPYWLSTYTTSTRFGTLLDMIGWASADRVLMTGSQGVSRFDPAGQLPLSYVQALERTEQGIIYHAPSGNMTFLSSRYYREWWRSRLAQWTFSDDSFDVMRYDEFGVVRDVTMIYNRAEVSYTDLNSSGRTVSAEDSTSVNTYGPKSLQVDSTHADANQAVGLAQWLVYTHKDSRDRLTRLVVSPVTNHDMFHAVLDLQVGDRILTRRKPQNTGSQIEQRWFVMGISHSFGNGVNEWTTELYVVPTASIEGPNGVWVLGVDVLGDGTVLGY
jgi:hypothetical protein